jgi:hypothetical protein
MGSGKFSADGIDELFNVETSALPPLTSARHQVMRIDRDFVE